MKTQVILLSVILVLMGVERAAQGDDRGRNQPSANAPQVDAAKSANAAQPRLVKLSKTHDVWVDPQRKLVIVNGEVAITDGPLEMFACPKGTKEHESLVAVNSTAQLVHTGLLVVGAVPGHPVQFVPEYQAASGTVIDIWVLWQDEDGKHRVRAQHLVKNIDTEKAMEYDWVFGGSGFFTDETSGKKYYHADAGDMICLSNFSSAMLDLPIESSQSNDALLFTAFTERCPPRGTKVRLVLAPRLKKQDEAEAKAAGDRESSEVGVVKEEEDKQQ